MLLLKQMIFPLSCKYFTMNRKSKWGNLERVGATRTIMARMLVWGYAPASLCMPILHIETLY